MIRWTLLALVLILTPALADDALDARGLYEKGEALLDQANFDGAADAFKAAAKAEPKNKYYRGRAIILVRVLKVRKFVAEAETDARWERSAQSLHAFYLREGLPDEAAALDLRVYTERPSATSAALLAEALLQAGKSKEALKLVAALPADQKDLQNRVYEGIALARLAKTDAAKKLYEGLDISEIDPGVLYDLARLEVLLGMKDEAVVSLTNCFAGLAAKNQKSFRKMAEQCADFTSMAKDPAFTAALNTESKLTESDCSGSSSGCGSCPKRSDCGSGKKEDGKQ